MRTRTAIAAGILLAASALTACSSSSHDNKAAATPHTTTAATSAPATSSSTTVKLSTKWLPKLKALDTSGVSDCQNSGSTACVEAMTAAVTVYGGIAKDINAAGAADEYKKTMADISQYTRAADAFDKAGCPGDPNADVGDSDCYSNALKVVTGPTMLQFIMPTDELTAGVS